MAYENSQAFLHEGKILTGVEQFENTCRIDVQSDKPIRKIISIKALPKITASEKVSDEVEVSGRTNYQIVFESDDNVITSSSSYVEWQHKIASEYEVNFLVPSIISNEIISFSTNEIAILTTININKYSIVSEKLSTVENLPEHYVVKQNTYDCQRIINSVSQSFNEVLEQENTSRISEILNYSAVVNVKSVSALIDAIAVEGEVLVDVVAKEGDDVVSINKVVDFKQELSMLSVVPNNIVDADVYLSDLKVTISAGDSEEKTNIIYSPELTVNAVAYSKEQVSVVEDAFSLKKQTLMTRECVNALSYENSITIKETISGAIDIQTDVDSVCFVLDSKIKEVAFEQKEDSLNINGVVNLDVLTALDSGERTKIEGGFQFSINVPEVKESSSITVSSRVESCKLRGGKIEVVCEILGKATNQTGEYISFVSSIEELEDKELDNSAIVVRVVKEGETIFDVAKELSVSPEELVNQNPTLEDGIEEGMRLVVYSPLVLDF